MSLAAPADDAFARAAAAVRPILAPWAAEGGPGGAVVLFDAAGPRHEAHAGFASLADRRPIGPGTAFRHASVSKHTLAALLLRSG
jgi:CubicO group peptidase (beta-lactamase class C family)